MGLGYRKNRHPAGIKGVPGPQQVTGGSYQPTRVLATPGNPALPTSPSSALPIPPMPGAPVSGLGALSMMQWGGIAAGVLALAYFLKRRK
jgi:hypothetical protein